MTRKYVAYIDEAGDEGLGKLALPKPSPAQSKWLVIGGILAREEHDRSLVAWRDEVMAMFPAKKRRDLHFRNLSHDQKVAAVELLAQKQFGISCACSNKITLCDGGKYFDLFRQKGHLYNFLTRYLLERLTSAVKEAANREGVRAELHVVFSRRGGTDYQSMRDYLILMRDGKEKIKPVRSIDWSVFSPDNIKVENHSLWAGLQIADVATSATAAALEPNIYGNYEPRYANTLAQRFLRKRNAVLDTGLILLPPIGTNPLDKPQREFALGLNKLWQAPGP
ncbi:MAG TPA: DUF3800 domain-containing protein [Sphingorhabdus sp.]|jgi:hypothetical protein|nr:DUF3800 domain-containing protein [Sphingorhabdus sp.]